MLRKFSLMAVVLASALTAGGCIIDDNNHYFDDTEVLRFQNHTPYLVDVAIDGHYLGTVPAYGNLDVEGDYEGLHTFDAATDTPGVTWPSIDRRIYNGDLIVFDLTNDGGYKVVQQSTKPKTS